MKKQFYLIAEVAKGEVDVEVLPGVVGEGAHLECGRLSGEKLEIWHSRRTKSFLW